MWQPESVSNGLRKRAIVQVCRSMEEWLKKDKEAVVGRVVVVVVVEGWYPARAWMGEHCGYITRRRSA